MATQRSGRIRLPTLSLSTPTAIRPSAPTNWEIPTTMPATAAVSDCSVMSQTSPNVEMVNCGITNSIETEWIRHRRPPDT